MTSQDISPQTAIMSLQIARGKADDDELSQKLSFITEQLQLIASNKYCRHYSPNLSVFKCLEPTYVSTKQVMDNDHVIQAVSLLKCSCISLTEMYAAINSKTLLATVGSASEDLTADDVTEQLTYKHVPGTNDLNVIYYVAGFIARSVCRTTKCDSCRETLHEEETAELMECVDRRQNTATSFF